MVKIVNKIPEAVERLISEVDGWTKEGTKAIRKEVERRMDLPKSGNVSGGKVSSKAGEAPTIRTRGLIDSLIVDPKRLHSSLGSTLIQAISLEKSADIKKKDGTTWHLDARPFLEVSGNTVLPTLENSLQEACRKAQAN